MGNKEASEKIIFEFGLMAAGNITELEAGMRIEKHISQAISESATESGSQEIDRIRTALKSSQERSEKFYVYLESRIVEGDEWLERHFRSPVSPDHKLELEKTKRALDWELAVNLYRKIYKKFTGKEYVAAAKIIENKG